MGILGGILVFELVAAMYGDAFSKASLPVASEVPNTTQLGGVLYTKYAFLFQISGLILLVAMIGAISLTMLSSSANIFVQLNDVLIKSI